MLKSQVSNLSKMLVQTHAQTADNALLMAYQRLPVRFVRGEGVWLFNAQGERWLDSISSIAVCGLGHAHAHISRAIAQQADTLIHTSNLVPIDQQERLAEELLPLADMERVFFCNSGAEANEAAIKMARLSGAAKSIKRPDIIVTEGGFHGRTMATLSASGNRKIQAGFEPLLPGFSRAAFGDVDAIEAIVQRNPNTVAVMVEPVQGEAGVVVPPENYLRDLRALCDQYGLLLILDEVQTGNGRCGSWYHCQSQNVRPDILTTAKGLGNGVPIGACMAQGDAAHLLVPGAHASTFGGNPLSCAAARAVIEVIERDKLLDAAKQKGELLRLRIKERLADNPMLSDVRGYGLMIGIELRSPCASMVGAALERGLLLNVTGGASGKVIRLLPPLIINEEEINFLVDTLCGLIEDHPVH